MSNGHGTSEGILTPKERKAYGVIATLEDERSILHVAIESKGAVMEALRTIAHYCDMTDLYVVCISTPNTILADLRGRMPDRTVGRNQVKMMQPEAMMLGKIGRMDLLHPKIRR